MSDPDWLNKIKGNMPTIPFVVSSENKKVYDEKKHIKITSQTKKLRNTWKHHIQRILIMSDFQYVNSNDDFNMRRGKSKRERFEGHKEITFAVTI